MISIPDNLFRRQQSAAWITPEGDFIPLTGNQQHADLASDFPGMPSDNQLAIDYPSTFAVALMGYVKVSSPFQCSWDGRGRRGDIRMATMADFMSQAVVWIRGNRYNPWDIEPSSDLIDVKVYVTTVTDPDIYKRAERDDTTVGDFVDRYGSREIIDFLYGKLMGESFVRTCRLTERRILRSRGLNESRHLVEGDALYRTIVRELKSMVR
jgi:hypothetical protein